jgi:predicted RNase H-like nuclease
MTIIGVDACKAGWVAIELRGGAARAFVVPAFDAIIAAAPARCVIAVDMPVGLVASGWREADRAVRAYLASRAASLFVIPPRRVVEQATYEDACRIAYEMLAKKISLQAFHLFPKLREVDRHVGDDRIIEVHPETSFAEMAGAPLRESKRTAAGARRRRRLLREQLIDVPRRPDGAGVDDLLDAAAAAWSGRRFARGAARRFPEQATAGDVDACGRRIAIVA